MSSLLTSRLCQTATPLCNRPIYHPCFCKVGAPLIENLFIEFIFLVLCRFGDVACNGLLAFVLAISLCLLRTRQAKLSGYVLASPAGHLGIDQIVIFIYLINFILSLSTIITCKVQSTYV
jgi:hypothetical protein